MRHASSRFLSLVVALALQGCNDRSAPAELVADETRAASMTPAEHTGRQIVLFRAQRVPADFSERVERLGGRLEASLDSIGISIVVGLSDGAAAALASDGDVRAVEPDGVMLAEGDISDDLDALTVDRASPALLATVEDDASAASPMSPALAPFYPRQWNMRAIHADEAWAAGYRGSRDVLVGIMGGVDYMHPDLEGLVDLDASVSFVPGDNAALAARGRLPFGDLFWHGTAEASIIATNAKVVAGINREVTFIAIKIEDSTGAVPAGAFLEGVAYAADVGVDIMVMPGTKFDKSQNPGRVAMFERAFAYAFRHGVLLVGGAGDDGLDTDHDGDLVRLCQLNNGICASATGPTSATGVNGPWENVDAMAPYAGYGRSIVDVASPGGTRNAFTRVWLPCTSTPSAGTRTPSGCRNKSVPLLNRVQEGVGISWSAPHVAGLAALLKAAHPMWGPAQLRAAILQSADDLGQPGTDPYYGRGRINVARALGLIQ